jgi:hypothetical protein
MAHLVMVHPGHPASAFLSRFLLIAAAGFTSLLATAGASAGSHQEGYRQEQREQPRLRQNRLQDKPQFQVVFGSGPLLRRYRSEEGFRA